MDSAVGNYRDLKDKIAGAYVIRVRFTSRDVHPEHEHCAQLTIMLSDVSACGFLQDHTERSIELNPSDPTPYHILGNWSLAFADMTWIEKRAAAALFGTPPTATYEDVVRHLHAAGARSIECLSGLV